MARAKDDKSELKIQPAKGRPMLTWVGKRPLSRVPAYPAQHIETFDPNETLDKASTSPDTWKDWPKVYPHGGLLFHGDNKEVLANLLASGYRGKVALVYIDPPFDSGADYVRRVQLRGQQSAQMEGDPYSLGEQLQYTDIWANDNYLQFMYERLLLLRELLAVDGSIVVHCDWHRSHYIRALLDEVFSPERLINEIVWRRKGGAALASMNRLSYATDTLLWYSKGDKYRFNPVYGDATKEYVDTQFRHVDPDGRRFMVNVMRSPHPRPNLMYDYKGYKTPPNGWAVPLKTMKELDAQGRLYFPESKDRQIYKKIFLDEYQGQIINNLWTDISTLKGTNEELENFPTQKPEELLARILALASDPNDLVLDCFAGSGTSVAVAQKLGRRWIACDINRSAIQITSRRLQTVARKQVEDQRLIRGDGDAPEPAQTAFTIWRVNDYDLQIQHNEAVNLACEFIGVERMRSDSYFDGTLGKNLVKVIPFNHPLTPLDLEELKRELEARPEEDRTVNLVCLGIELASQGWIEDWNKLRRGKNAVNRIEVIELRADPKYGGVIRHEPATAHVKVARANGRLSVIIEDFISPTIIKRLDQQNGPLRPQVDDWRAMVDSVAIDTSYDGKVFNISLVDAPERKPDLPEGTYDLEAPSGKQTTVAVKIIDMLGEEVLVTEVV